MNKRIDYNLLIEEIKKNEDITITQNLAKKLYNDELPKSCFEYNYLKNGKNALGRFLMDNKETYSFEIIPAQIVVKKRS